MSLVWQYYPAGGGELLTALAYADHAHDDGSSVRPSVRHVANKTRQSERTVQRYLAKMREREWLLVVRFADGGRGFATEYRVNPAWIANPDKVSPFSSKQKKRVTPGAEKGDTQGEERVTQVSPQPPRTTIKPTTTVFDGYVPVENHGSPLTWPDAFLGAAADSATHILDGSPHESRQWILDEIAGRIELRQVRSPLGLLKKLVDLAAKGLFIPTAAISYRQMKAQSISKSRDPLSSGLTISTPEKKKLGLEELAKLKAKIAADGKVSRRYAMDGRIQK